MSYKNYLNKTDEKIKIYSWVKLDFLIMILMIFLSLLRKGVYPYEFMKDWENFIKNLIAWITRILK